MIVDDRPRLLAAMKDVLGEKLTTVFVRQGHYAADAADKVINPPPNSTIDAITDPLDISLGLPGRF